MKSTGGYRQIWRNQPFCNWRDPKLGFTDGTLFCCVLWFKINRIVTKLLVKSWIISKKKRIIFLQRFRFTWFFSSNGYFWNSNLLFGSDTRKRENPFGHWYETTPRFPGWSKPKTVLLFCDLKLIERPVMSQNSL